MSSFLILDEKQKVQMEFEGNWPKDVKENFLNDLRVIEDFITEDEEASVIQEIEPYLKRMRYERDHWVIFKISNSSIKLYKNYL